MIKSMEADIFFDRNIDKKKHYFSPGGYEITNKKGESLGFDFIHSYGNVDDKIPNLIHMGAYDLDIDAFPDAEKKLEDFIKNINGFDEFFVYTGEAGGTEELMYPMKICNVIFFNDKGERFDIEPKCLKKVNDLFETELERCDEK